MKRLIICCIALFLLASCEAGKFTPERYHRHNMGKENICEKNPQRCIEVDGTSIDW